MTAKAITGDLLESDAQYIVHQCNCCSWRAAYLAKSVFTRYPYADIYSERQATARHDKPGTIIIRGNGQDERYVIAILGQYYPGKSRVNQAIDSYKKRTDYFFSGLQEIAKIKDLKSIAFPFGIGCGAAGNDWALYHRLIDKLSNHLTDKVDVFIYKFE